MLNRAPYFWEEEDWKWTPQNMKAFRALSGYTQEQMAALAGVSPQTYQAWEQGRRRGQRVNYSLLDRILEAWKSSVLDWSQPIVGLTPANIPILVRIRPEQPYVRLQAGQLVAGVFLPSVDVKLAPESLSQLLGALVTLDGVASSPLVVDTHGGLMQSIRQGEPVVG